MKIEILGSGTSMGVPMAGCDCEVCRSTNPKDKRLRTSCYIRLDNHAILIDTSADYRQQMLRAGIKWLDAVLYTHHHVDHVLGLDDLRSFNLLRRQSIPLYAMQETGENIRRIFRYAFEGGNPVSSVPQLIMHTIDEHPFELFGTTINPVPLMHGQMPVMGFRIGDFAYCTDVSYISPASHKKLKGLKILILGALRFKPHPTHFSIAQAVAEAQKIGAEATYFTHISHAILHDKTEASLPAGIHLAYDGLQFEL